MMFVTIAVLDTFREFFEKLTSQSNFFLAQLLARDSNFAEKCFVRDVFLRIFQKDAEQLFQRIPYFECFSTHKRLES